MRYPIILMDADDTLLDFTRAESCAIRDTLRPFGGDLERLAEEYSEINKQCWQAFERGEVDKGTMLERRFAILFRRYGISADPQATNDAYRGHLAGYSFVIPQAEALCRRLKARGHRLYIVTNGTADVQKPRFAASGLERYADGVFISEELGVQKPERGFFDLVFQALGQPDRRDCVILGDSPTSDMLGGERYGIDTCWFNPRGKDGGERWTYEIQSLLDFLPIAEGGAL